MKGKIPTQELVFIILFGLMVIGFPLTLIIYSLVNYYG